MADTYNTVALPATSSKAEVKPDDIIFSRTPAPIVKGATLVTGNGVIAAGTVLGRITASGKYAPYASGNVDGSQTPTGVLLLTTDTTDADALGNIVLKGVLKYDALTGLDAGAITALNGRADADRNMFVF